MPIICVVKINPSIVGTARVNDDGNGTLTLLTRYFAVLAYFYYLTLMYYTCSYLNACVHCSGECWTSVYVRVYHNNRRKQRPQWKGKSYEHKNLVSNNVSGREKKNHRRCLCQSKLISFWKIGLVHLEVNRSFVVADSEWNHCRTEFETRRCLPRSRNFEAGSNWVSICVS